MWGRLRAGQEKAHRSRQVQPTAASRTIRVLECQRSPTHVESSFQNTGQRGGSCAHISQGVCVLRESPPSPLVPCPRWPKKFWSAFALIHSLHRNLRQLASVLQSRWVLFFFFTVWTQEIKRSTKLGDVHYAPKKEKCKASERRLLTWELRTAEDLLFGFHQAQNWGAEEHLLRGRGVQVSSLPWSNGSSSWGVECLHRYSSSVHVGTLQILIAMQPRKIKYNEGRVIEWRDSCNCGTCISWLGGWQLLATVLIYLSVETRQVGQRHRKAIIGWMPWYFVVLIIRFSVIERPLARVVRCWIFNIRYVQF